MKSSNLLREYVRSIISEGVLQEVPPAAQAASEVKNVTDNVDGWLRANSQTIEEVADDYHNPIRVERENLIGLVKAAFTNDKDNNHEYPFTTYALCIEIAGTKDIWSTELINKAISALSTVINEAAQAVALPIIGILALAAYWNDADAPIQSLGVPPKDLDQLKKAATISVTDVRNAVKPYDLSVSRMLGDIADGLMTSEVRV